MQEIIKWLDEQIAGFTVACVQSSTNSESYYIKGRIDQCKSVKSRIKSLGDGWISVEDRLPEKEDNVLAVLGGEVCLMAYFEFTENGVSNKVWGYVYDSINGDAIFDDNYYPTHWQPLPSPPKQ